MLKTLRQKFMSLPEPLRDWLASERVTLAIIEINKRLGLFGILIEIIPTAILRLVVKDLEPKNFIAALIQELDIDTPAAAAIAQEIETKILRPVELPLRNQLGVDIKMIYAAAPSNISAPSRPSGLPPLRVPSTPAAMPKPQEEIMKVPINKT